MEHKSLTAEIASKGKKHLQNFEPTFFSQIPYSRVTEINYLRDLEEKKQSLDFPIFEFEKDFGEEAPVNEFDMLANTLYKKIMQQGYIQEKKAPSKKKKKTKNPLEYDYEDEWINDEEAITVKKNIYVKLQNFKCLNQGIDEFYNSELYKSSLSQIQQQSKKKTNEITMDAQELELIKKKMKENVSMNRDRMKDELQGEKPTMMIPENSLTIEADVVNKPINGDQLNGHSVKSETGKNDEVQSASHSSDINKQDEPPRSFSKEENDGNIEQKPKKPKKAPPKQKPIKKTNKIEKKQKEQSEPVKDQELAENKVYEKEDQGTIQNLNVKMKSTEGQILEGSERQMNGNSIAFKVAKSHASQNLNYQMIKKTNSLLIQNKDHLVNEMQQ